MKEPRQVPGLGLSLEVGRHWEEHGTWLRVASLISRDSVCRRFPEAVGDHPVRDSR
jgi:hypothetical protein